MYLVQPVYECPAQLVPVQTVQDNSLISFSKSAHYKKEVKEAFMRKNAHKAKIKKDNPATVERDKN